MPGWEFVENRLGACRQSPTIMHQRGNGDAKAAKNEGATLERACRRAAFVVWPRAKTFDLVASALPGTLAGRARGRTPKPDSDSAWEFNRGSARSKSIGDAAVHDIFALAWRWGLTKAAGAADDAIVLHPRAVTPDRVLPARGIARPFLPEDVPALPRRGLRSVHYLLGVAGGRQLRRRHAQAARQRSRRRGAARHRTRHHALRRDGDDGCDHLLTWNFRHIDNAEIKSVIRRSKSPSGIPRAAHSHSARISRCLCSSPFLEEHDLNIRHAPRPTAQSDSSLLLAIPPRHNERHS